MPKTTPTPPKVKESIVRELAASPRASSGKIKRIAKEHGVEEACVKQIGQREKVDVQALRQKIAEQGMGLVITAHERIKEKLEDDAAMKETPLRDLALTQEKLVNAAVTAQDGHAPKMQFDFKFIAKMQANQANYDAMAAARRLEQKRTATEAVIVPSGP